MSAQIRLIDGNRLHLQHGPIDVLVRAEGGGDASVVAYDIAADRFKNLLPELVDELSGLRAAVSANCGFRSPVARRMWRATMPYARYGITPMAAVAGSVADELLACMTTGEHRLSRVFVNNGGDIALWNRSCTPFEIAMAIPGDMTTAAAQYPAKISLSAEYGVGGIATSGWRGRSHSLGIADAVTVLACNAASADATATLLANAVDFDSPAVDRRPADSLDPDSDLGDALVTINVGQLRPKERAVALNRGVERAQSLRRCSPFEAALLLLQGEHRTVGNQPLFQRS